MPEYIDRDPVEIMNYAKEVMKYYENMGSLLAKSNALVQGYADDLDDKCAELATKYADVVRTLYTQIESYRNLANQLDKNARSLAEARNGFHF